MKPSRSSPAAPSNLAETVRRLERLPSPPAVASKIMNWALQDDPDIAELCEIVRLEPSLSLKILRLANAKAYGLQGQVTKIEQAALLLGITSLKNAILGLCIRDTLLSQRRTDDPVVGIAWRHSLTTAFAAQVLAEWRFPGLPAAFACGLIHDCGKLALLMAAPEAYEPLLSRFDLLGQPLFLAESAVLGLDHAAAGKWLTTAWGLPKPLIDAAWLHHLPVEAMLEMDEHGGLVPLVALAELAAHAVLAEPLPPEEATRLAALTAWARLTDEDFEAAKLEIARRFFECKELFDGGESDAVAHFYQALQRVGGNLSQAGVLLDQSRNECLRVNRVCQALNVIGCDIAAAPDRESQLAAARALLEHSFGAAQGCITFLDRDQSRLEGLAWGPAGSGAFTCALDEDLNPRRPDWEPGHPALAFLPRLLDFHERTPALDGLSQASAVLGFAKPCHCLPLIHAGRYLGEFLLIWKTPPVFLPGEIDCLLQVASLLAAAFDRLLLARQLEERNERLSLAMRKMHQINQRLIQTERLAAVGQLAAGAAHEINNPLAILYARLQILGLKEKDETLRTAFRQMEEQIGRISNILTQLMDFARPAQPQFARVALNTLLENILSMMAGNFEKRGIVVRLTPDPDLPLLSGDPRQLEQVFLNLFLNAEHAMEDTGGTLEVSTRARPNEGVVLVTVQDTGTGISPENLKRIFDPFFTTKEGKGTGLGLSTSYSIVKSHQGDIRVASTPGKGTTFTVLLPLGRPGTSEPERKPAKPAARRGHGADILVVDDERSIRDLLAEALTSRGHSVETCANGEEALALIGRKNFQLMLLDIRMPVRNGLWVLSEIRRLSKKMPVIVLTGLASGEEKEQALQMGALKCIQKPFKVDDLLRDVEAALKK